MRGFTLLELMVAISVSAIALLVGGLSLASIAPSPTALLKSRLDSARASAIRSGVTVRSVIGGKSVFYHPDGTASAPLLDVDSLRIALDPLTGEARIGRR